MPMPRKRPLADPRQYYAYIWELDGEVIYAGYGRNNRGRPTTKASWTGRSEELQRLLVQRCHDIKWTVTPCQSETEAVDLERQLIKDLKPKYNKAPQRGGWKGMHTKEGLQRISKANTGRPVTDKQREARRKTMQLVNLKKWGK